jgi:hypothetical protein
MVNLLAYKIGERSCSVLYAAIPLNTSKVAPTAGIALDFVDAVFYLGSSVYGLYLQHDHVIELTPQLPAVSSWVTPYEPDIQLTNVFGSQGTAGINVFYLNSFDAISAASTQGQVDLKHLVNINRTAPFPQKFQVPQYLLFNGSMKDYINDCENQKDCWERNITIATNFLFDRGSPSFPTTAIQDLHAGQAGTYILTTKQLVITAPHNDSIVTGVLEMQFPSNPSDWTCVKSAVSSDESYLIAACKSQSTAATLINSFFLGENPFLFAAWITTEFGVISEMKIVDDYLYVLNQLSNGDSRIDVHYCNFTDPKMALSYVTAWTSALAGMPLSISHFEVYPYADYYYLAYLDANSRTIGVTQLDMDQSVISPAQVFAFSLDDGLAQFYEDSRTKYIRFLLTHVDSQAYKFTFLIITEAGNHFESFYDRQAGAFKVTQVYQRYGDFHVYPRVKATNDFFVLYAKPNPRSRTPGKSSGFIVYSRKTYGKSGVLFKNVYSMLPVAEQSSLVFDFIPINHPKYPETVGKLYAGLGTDVNMRTWWYNENISVIAWNATTTSKYMNITAKNDYGSSQVQVTINYLSEVAKANVSGIKLAAQQLPVEVKPPVGRMPIILAVVAIILVLGVVLAKCFWTESKEEVNHDEPLHEALIVNESA